MKIILTQADFRIAISDFLAKQGIPENGSRTSSKRSEIF
jgi:hypothetical protein